MNESLLGCLMLRKFPGCLCYDVWGHFILDSARNIMESNINQFNDIDCLRTRHPNSAAVFMAEHFHRDQRNPSQAEFLMVLQHAHHSVFNQTLFISWFKDFWILKKATCNTSSCWDPGPTHCSGQQCYWLLLQTATEWESAIFCKDDQTRV